MNVHSISSIVLSILLLFPLVAVGQSIDSTNTSAADSCVPRGRMMLLVPMGVSLADFDELNTVLRDNKYHELEGAGADLLNSVGIDMLVYSGYRHIVFLASYRELLGGNSYSDGETSYRGMFFSFGTGVNLLIAQRLRFSFGYAMEFSTVGVNLQAGNRDWFGMDSDFESAIASGRGDSTIRTIHARQWAFAPLMHLNWDVLTWGGNDGRPQFNLELGLKAQYAFPVMQSMEVDDIYVEAPSFNFSRMLFGLSVGWGVEL